MIWGVLDGNVSANDRIDYMQRVIHEGKADLVRWYIDRNFGHTFLENQAAFPSAQLNAISLLYQFMAGEQPGSFYTQRGTSQNETTLGFTDDELAGATNLITCPPTLFPPNNGPMAFFNAIFNSTDMTVVNNRPPIIILTGANPQLVCLGQAYAEPGAIAVPGAGANFGATIVGSNVNTAVPGTYTVTYRATDAAGNKNTATRTVIVKDDAPPTVTFGAPTPPPNANGWYGLPSGIANVTKPITLASDGAGQSASGTATDMADNSASATVSGINIDKTPPTLTVSLSPNSLWPANHKMVPVTILVAASDGLSGLDGSSLKISLTSSEGDLAPGTGNTTGDTNGQDGYAHPVSVTPGPLDGSGHSSTGISLRAERGGSNPVGRVYAVIVLPEVSRMSASDVASFAVGGSAATRKPPLGTAWGVAAAGAAGAGAAGAAAGAPAAGSAPPLPRCNGTTR